MNRVALIGENSIEYINILLDIWNNEDCVVLIDWKIPLQTAIELMNDADVHTCFIEKELVKNKELPKHIRFLTFERKAKCSIYLPKSAYIKFKPNYSKNEAVVIYSSGTTGKSKGIILSHFAINTNADAIINYMKLSKDDCIYIAKSLSHSSTITGELLVSLKTQTKLVVSPTIVPPRYILDKIKKFNISIICLNPTLLSMFIDELQRKNYNIDESSLKIIYVSGSILNDKIYTKAHQSLKHIQIYNVYGLSEAGPRLTAQRAECCLSNSVGKPINGIDIIIVDENGNPVSTGKKGIIHVNTPSRFIKYISGEEKNHSKYKDWLNTGDIGFFDINGELHIIDRIDNMIVIDSHKIYPNEIEETIINSTKISECSVVKIEYKDVEIISCLYCGEKISNKEIFNKLQKKLAPYEIPKYFIQCSSLPKTLNYKISKYSVKEKIIEAIEKEGIQ